MGEPIDGKAIAETIRNEIAVDVEKFQKEHGCRPRLAAIVVGEDPASQVYVRNKIKACELAGIQCESHHLTESVSETELLNLIRRLNKSKEVDGILLQLPLPVRFDRDRALLMIHPEKDVDGLHPMNVGLLVQNRAKLIACTPQGILEALKRCGIEIAGKRAVIIGRSDLVGKPMALLMLHENATVTVCHSKTSDLNAIVSQCDIVIVAIGVAAFLQPDAIRPGAVVVDVGINVLKDQQQIVSIFGQSSPQMKQLREGKSVMVGDVHPAAYNRSSRYTPVPGGVGPLTVAMLLRNTLIAAQRRAQHSTLFP